MHACLRRPTKNGNGRLKTTSSVEERHGFLMCGGVVGVHTNRVALCMESMDRDSVH